LSNPFPEAEREDALLDPRKKMNAGSAERLVTGRMTAEPEVVAVIAAEADADAADHADVAATPENADQHTEATEAEEREVAAEDPSMMADPKSCVKEDASSVETRDTLGGTAPTAEAESPVETDSVATTEETETETMEVAADTHPRPEPREVVPDHTPSPPTDVVVATPEQLPLVDVETTLPRVLLLVAETTLARDPLAAATETVAEALATTELAAPQIQTSSINQAIKSNESPVSTTTSTFTPPDKHLTFHP